MTAVKFGTSGWRAIIAEDFTFRNVEVVTRAIAHIVRASAPAGGDASIVIGFDGRFLSERFARACALTLASEGVRALLPRRVVPTPAVSYMVRARGLSGGVVITASHNPPEYNGVKFSDADGAPAPIEVTRRIEEYANGLLAEAGPDPRFPAVAHLQQEQLDRAAAAGRIEWYDPYNAYRDALFERVRVGALRDAGLRVVADVFYGAGRGFLPEVLRDAGCRVTALHDEANPLFGGTRPDPVAENVQELASLVRESDAALGLAVDGDADRFGIVDGDGAYIPANYILALLVDYLATSRGWQGEVVRTAATSHLVDAAAAHHGLAVHETPTGFKYIGSRLVERPDDFVLGGEESSGLTVRGHVPEKDGILACLLVAEMVAATGRSLRSALRDLFSRVGERVVDRLDLELEEARKQALLSRLAETPPQSIGGLGVADVQTLDGYKFILTDGGFVAFRASGTEPLVRCYLDAPSQSAMDAMRAGVRQLIATL